MSNPLVLSLVNIFDNSSVLCPALLDLCIHNIFNITGKQNAFIGQTNNVLCHIRKLTSNVKYSYCTSYDGCELWSLTASNISDFCTAYSVPSVQIGIYRIPQTVLRCLLYVIALPVFVALPVFSYMSLPYLYLTNSVAVQLTLQAHAHPMSHNSSVRLRRIVYTLLAVIHQWV